MSAWLLVTALLAPPSGDAWAPAEAPPPTPWARAGARGWRLCQEAERQARLLRSNDGPRGSNDDQSVWRRRAEQCPHAVEVLTAAAQGEIVEAASLFAEIEGDGYADTEITQSSLQTVIDRHHAQVERALRWLDAAIAEAERRGDRPPREARYYRAYALTSLGQVERGREAITEVITTGDVERWRSERMAALVEMQAGDVEAALARAQRGVFDAPPEDRLISRYIRALVLDRAGASAAAFAELQALRREPGSPFARAAMESVLPIHERLFLRGLDHLANDERSPALRFLQAYLDRAEPEEPERVLARRHLDELTPTPAPVGGP